MIKIILVFFIPLSLFGSKMLSYNIYDRTDRADVMITFDVPYEGVIKKSITNSSGSSKKIIIKLQGTSIESSKLKQVSSEFIKTLAITPLKDYVQLIASVNEGVELKVSKTADSYGLRLRFQKSKLATRNSNAPKETYTPNTQQTNNLSALPTKKTNDMTQSYYTVIAILIVGILILFIIRKKVTPKNIKQNQQNPKKQTTNSPKKASSEENSEVSIRFQKNIDDINSVVMLDFNQQSYLVMMGSTNVLLDRFSDNIPTSQDEFNVILKEHQHMLDGFLNSPDMQNNSNNVKSYSQKASSISYDV
jgi:hypothetical protein